MPNILITGTDAYPSIPDIGDTLESHTLALQAIRDSLETGERQDGNYLESFVTFQELVDLGIIDTRGEFILTLGDVELGILNAITDVTITGTPANNEVLAFDTATGDWINQTAAEAGLVSSAHTHVEADITNLQTYLINISGQLLGSLNNVTLDDPPLDKEFLVFDLTTGDWINQTSTQLGIAGVDLGTTIDAALRWSGTKWAENANVLFSASGKITAVSYDDVFIRLGKDLRIYETADVKNAHFYYNGDFNIDISGVGDHLDIRPGNGGRLRIRGANSGLQLRDGGLFTVWSPDDTQFFQISVADTTGLANLSALIVQVPTTFRIIDGGLTDFGDFSHDGTNFLSAFTNTGVWNITGALLRTDGEIIMKERAANPVGESDYGVIWVKNTVPNELWFTNDASQDFQLVSDLVADTTPQLGGNLASNGFDILMADNDKVIFGDGGDMQMFNIGGTGTSVISNLLANAILDFTFASSNKISFDGANSRIDIRDGWTLRIRNSTDVEFADLHHDGANFIVDGLAVGAHINLTPGNGGRVRIVGTNHGLHLRAGGLFAIFSPNDTQFFQVSVADTTGVANLSALVVQVPAIFRIIDGGLTDFGDFSHDGTDFNAAFTNTIDWNLTGITSLRIAGVAVATLNTNWSAADITSGTLAVLRGGTGVTTKTGTGSVVLSASPTFTGTPVFGAIRINLNIDLNGNIVGDGASTITGIETIIVDATGDITKASHGNYLYHQSTVYDDDQEGGVTLSTAAASGGADGDIWFRYTA